MFLVDLASSEFFHATDEEFSLVLTLNFLREAYKRFVRRIRAFVVNFCMADGIWWLQLRLVRPLSTLRVFSHLES